MDRLIVFTRYPEAGKTKTRLIRSLGPDGAADLQRKMTEHVLRNVRALKAAGEVEVEVWFDGGTEQLMQGWLGSDLHYVPQKGDDLGVRMAAAFKASFEGGSTKTVLMGIDCPGMRPDVMQSAFDRLDDHDVVIGPAFDGGYYLIGLRGNAPQLFQDIEWGSGDVLGDTLKVAKDSSLSVAQLEELADVDVPADLGAWSAATGNISVIIPALNEEASIESAIASARQDSSIEVIVADGGSDDETVSIASRLGATVVPAPRGRGTQMNAGVLASSGDILVFLHADTILPDGYVEEVRKVLGCPGVAVGAFTLSIEGEAKGLRMVEKGVGIRSRRFMMPYGDQALFMERSLFNAAGGYSHMPLMEDVQFVHRIHRMGRIQISEKAVVTSGRRWQELGVLRTTLMNQLMLVGYKVGVSPERLAGCYKSKKVS
jgi:rSAM/selenodomain-associated transferase 2/rSAM/selenodomain-associated transferase 1